MCWRMTNYKSLFNHPYYRKKTGMLSLYHMASIEKFITENEFLDKDDFAHKVNRWGLDMEMTKIQRKHQSLMWELVSVANTMGPP